MLQGLQQCVWQGDVLYDKGANAGAQLLVAQSVTQGDCLIYAFEPGFSTSSTLCRNVLLNDCSRTIIPMTVALSDTTDVLRLHYSNTVPGASCHRLDGANVGFLAKGLDPMASLPVFLLSTG